MCIWQLSSLGEICEAMNEGLSPSSRTRNIGHLSGKKIEWSFLSPGQRKRSSILQRSYKREVSNFNKLCFFFIAFWKDKESLDKKTTDLLAEKVRFLLEIKPLAFNQFMKMGASLFLITTMQMLDFVASPIAGLHVTSARPCHWWSRTKAFLSSRNQTLFSRISSRKNSLVFTPNLAALSRGCKRRIVRAHCMLFFANNNLQSF